MRARPVTMVLAAGPLVLMLCVGGGDSFSAEASATSESIHEGDLLKQARNPDPELRRVAVRALKPLAETSERTRKRLIELLTDAKESDAVRIEAARSLSFGTARQNATAALLRVAQSDAPDRVRGMAYKALFWAAQGRPEISGALLKGACEADGEARWGALWGLALCGSEDVKRALVSIAADTGNSQRTRVEALKSLFHFMSDPDVRSNAVNMAASTRTPEQVRAASILMLSAWVDDKERDVLARISSSDDDPMACSAARTALQGRESDEVTRFFHLVRRDLLYGTNDLLHDPIDDE